MALTEPDEREVDLTRLLEKVADGRDLTGEEAQDVFRCFMTGAASEIQMAGFLVGLRAKGVHPVEVAGGVRALREAMVPVPADDPSSLVDTAGTGGGGVTTFNISTAAALVVHGAPGMDEISPAGPTEVAEVVDGQVRHYTTSPEALGLEAAGLGTLAGGEPEENAETIRRVLDGEAGAPRTATLLNAAAAIYVAGKAATLEEGVTRAASSVDEGRARDALERLRSATRRR